MTDSTPKSYSSDPALYLYTSLTSGSSHIVTATSRMETILKANKIPFKAIDIATDEKARMLWGRRAGKDESGRARKIPGLVQMGLVLGDIVEVEDWNEYGELRQHVTIYHEGGAAAKSAAPTPSGTPSKAPSSQVNTKENDKPAMESSKSVKEAPKPPEGPQPGSFTLAMRQVSQEAAQKAKDGKKKVIDVLTGVGEADPAKKDLEDSAAKPSPIAIEPASERHAIDTKSLMQSPTSSAWKNEVPGKPSTPRHSIDRVESLQSPNSSTWKSGDSSSSLSVTTHRGSSVSEASAEEIKQIEEEETIQEEEEESDEDD